MSREPTRSAPPPGWAEAANYLEANERWRRAADLTIAETETVVGRVGRNDGPAILFDLWFGGCIAEPVLVALVPQVWSGAEWPASSIPRRIWLDWFRLGAYPTLTEAVTIYRGATPRYARGISWTTDRDRAAWFAERWTLTTGKAAHVYTVAAPPAAILADIDAVEGEGVRQEAEIIADPAMLPRLRRA